MFLQGGLFLFELIFTLWYNGDMNYKKDEKYMAIVGDLINTPASTEGMKATLSGAIMSMQFGRHRRIKSIRQTH